MGSAIKVQRAGQVPKLFNHTTLTHNLTEGGRGNEKGGETVWELGLAMPHARAWVWPWAREGGGSGK